MLLANPLPLPSEFRSYRHQPPCPGKVYSFLVARDLLRASKMAQRVKVHEVQAWQPELDPMVEVEKQSLELVLYPHIHTMEYVLTSTYARVHTHTHIIFKHLLKRGQPGAFLE